MSSSFNLDSRQKKEKIWFLPRGGQEGGNREGPKLKLFRRFPLGRKALRVRPAERIQGASGFSFQVPPQLSKPVRTPHCPCHLLSACSKAVSPDLHGLMWKTRTRRFSKSVPWGHLGNLGKTGPQVLRLVKGCYWKKSTGKSLFWGISEVLSNSTRLFLQLVFPPLIWLSLIWV